MAFKGSFKRLNSSRIKYTTIGHKNASEALQSLIGGGVVKIDYKELYKERLIQVEKDIKKANKLNNWTAKKELINEKNNLINRLKKYEEKQYYSFIRSCYDNEQTRNIKSKS